MDFLINNIGWFFCIAIVSILALIGYKADKKEKQQNNTSNKYIPKEESSYEKTPTETKDESKEEDNFYYNPQEEIKPIENNEPQMSTKNEMDEEMAALYEPLPPMQDQNKLEENPKENSKDQSLEDLYYFDPIKEQDQEQIPNQIEEPTIEQNIQLDPQTETTQEPTQIVPDINNLENLNISLQDLENKNYNQLLNKMNQQEPTQELNQGSQTEIHDNPIDQEPQANITSMEQDNNENQQEQSLDQQEIQEQTVSTVEPTQEEEQISTQPEQNTENTGSEINKHHFDNEINNEIESEQQPVEQNDAFAFNTQENKYEGEIPEIFANNQQNNDSINDTSYLEKSENSNNETNNETNLYNDSIDDDIWKF